MVFSTELHTNEQNPGENQLLHTIVPPEALVRRSHQSKAGVAF